MFWPQVVGVVLAEAFTLLLLAATAKVEVDTQELPSTTNTVYVPAARPLIDWLNEVKPEGPVQEKVIGAVPFVTATVAVPVLPPQDVPVPDAVEVMLHGTGTVMLNVPKSVPGDGQALSTAFTETVYVFPASPGWAV